MGLHQDPSFRPVGPSQEGGYADKCPNPARETLSDDTPACRTHAGMAREMRNSHSGPIDDRDRHGVK